VARCVDRVGPDRVQLNTVTRPPAEDYAVGVSSQRLAGYASLFHPRAEIIADFRGVHRETQFVAGREQILQMLLRRPCSVDDIADGLGMHRNEVLKYVEELDAENLIEKAYTGQKLYYRAATEPSI
jgi:wyosine [tRNA(Phe)-imidazoG37] synthetase (radical SAM superfamily)